MARALPIFVLVFVLAQPVVAAYPDPGRAPHYFDSDCISKHDRRFVYDYVDAMDAEWGPQVEGAACEIYATTGAHFVLAAVQSTDGEPLESYALHLFERWGVGQKGTNDGLLLLYVKDYQLDGKASALRIEVGYGLTGVVNSLVAADAIDLMRDSKQRALDAGETPEAAVTFALASGAHLLLGTLRDNYHDGHFPAPALGLRDVPMWVWVVAVVIILAIVSALARAAKHPSHGWGYYPGSPRWNSGLGRVFVPSSGGGWGGGGFGGGGFGGGRSGGGGGSGGF